MSKFFDRPDDETFEKYLDKQLSPAEQERVEESLGEDQAEEIDLANQVDASLVRQHQVAVPSVDEIESWLVRDDSASTPVSQTENVDRSPEPLRPSQAKGVPKVWIGIIAVAAAVLAMFLLFPRSQPTPFFELRPLAQLYAESVDAGFKPYYFCEDDERFASTFANRQGQALLLKDLPDDRRMIGLSYLGGLSRSTTAILCIAKEQPVVVFVDKGELDNADVVDATQRLHVHRSNVGSVVVYEVSPFSEPLMSPFLKQAE